MAQTLLTRSIILAKFNVGDYDNAYLALSRDYGRLRLFAKSSRKPKAKLSAHLEPGTFVSTWFVPRFNRDNYLIVGAKTIFKPNFHKLSSNQNKTISNTLFLTRKLTQETEIEPNNIQAGFKLLKNCLANYLKPGISANDLILFQTAYLLKLLNYAGFKPDFKKCIHCQKKVSNNSKIYYDIINGGIACCGLANSPIIPLNCLKLANFLLLNPFSRVSKLKVHALLVKKVSAIAKNHLRYCVE
ncbi:MAG: DNA repair protein RecO [Patescibacteria group bacterium]|nr:DNA repair protein RecO [Patescibacteria group bacterium]